MRALIVWLLLLMLLLQCGGLVVLCALLWKQRAGEKESDEEGSRDGRHQWFSTAFCSGCGQALPDTNEVCCRCGLPVGRATPVLFCQCCGSKVVEGAAFCNQCGKKLDEE